MSLSKAMTAIGGAAVMLWAPQLAMASSAHAAGCPDAEVVFARGTTEAPGAGPVGDAFVDSLRTQVGQKSVNVYGVDYPATTDFPTAVQGISDARTHVLATAANCPQTSIVLGGFSQGAAVMGFVTDSAVPDGVSPDDVPAPMPPDIADHVAAVALFGKPSLRFMHVINDPPVTVGPLYQAKTDDLCADNDLVCDPHGHSFSAHNTYVDSGLTDQAATFVAARLQTAWAAQAAEQSFSPHDSWGAAAPSSRRHPGSASARRSADAAGSLCTATARPSRLTSLGWHTRTRP